MIVERITNNSQNNSLEEFIKSIKRVPMSIEFSFPLQKGLFGTLLSKEIEYGTGSIQYTRGTDDFSGVIRTNEKVIDFKNIKTKTELFKVIRDFLKQIDALDKKEYLNIEEDFSNDFNFDEQEDFNI